MGGIFVARIWLVSVTMLLTLVRRPQPMLIASPLTFSASAASRLALTMLSM